MFITTINKNERPSNTLIYKIVAVNTAVNDIACFKYNVNSDNQYVTKTFFTPLVLNKFKKINFINLIGGITHLIINLENEQNIELDCIDEAELLITDVFVPIAFINLSNNLTTNVELIMELSY